MEQEWFPDPNWYSSWEEPKEPEYQPRLGMMINPGVQDPTWQPSGWEVPPPRRTFKPSQFPVTPIPWLTSTQGRFGALSTDDSFQHRIMMLTPEEEVSPCASLPCNTASPDQTQHSAGADGQSLAMGDTHWHRRRQRRHNCSHHRSRRTRARADAVPRATRERRSAARGCASLSWRR